MSRILIIDDDKALCRSLELQLQGRGHESRSAYSSAEGERLFRAWAPEMALLDFHLPDGHGLDLLPRLTTREDCPVVIMTGDHDTRAAIEAMGKGAADYIRKPFELDDVLRAIEKHRRTRRQKRSVSEAPGCWGETSAPFQFVGTDRKVVEVIKQIGLFARSRVPVLIRGESGTGKELVARMLHEAVSTGEPFVAINCSAVVPTLLESEFFGHERGAFTGADKQKTGQLEHAGHGTVFLDEIGDMPASLQGKLLRVIQEEEFCRVGGLDCIHLRARVLSATNRDLDEMIRQGTFREDLYYRLSVSTIVTPPLRELRGDIPLLTRHIIGKVGRKLHRHIESVEERAMATLVDYDWPGNIRELENILTRAVALARGTVIKADDLELSFGKTTARSESGSALQTLAEAEKEHIGRMLALKAWNITHTAQALAISPTTLRKKIGDFGLIPPR